MESVIHGGVEVDFCHSCRSFWFDKDEILRVLTPSYPKIDAYRDWSKILGWPQIQSGLRCPRCKKELVDRPLSSRSELQVRYCLGCQGIMMKGTVLDEAAVDLEVDQLDKDHLQRERSFSELLVEAFLPVEVNIPPQRLPLATYLLIAINVVFHGAIVWAGIQREVINDWGIFPHQIGTLHWWYTVATCTFLHANWWHLLSNMYFLYIFGDNVEDLAGRPGFIGLYAAFALSSSLIDNLLGGHPYTPRIGASGAISGICGVYLIWFRRAKLRLRGWTVPAWGYFLLWSGVNFLGAFSDSRGTAWWAHLGGFAAGLVFGILSYRLAMSRHPQLVKLQR